MVTIVGRKIIMTQGEDVTFRLLMRDSKGKEITNLSESDLLTIRLKHSMDSNIYFNKSATPIHVKDRGVRKVYHLIQFTKADTRHLRAGDYYYDVILENENRRFTVINKSILTLEKSISPSDIEDDSSNIILLDADSEIDYNSLMSITPLVGSFPMTNYNRVGASSVDDDDLILFSRVR